MECGSGVLSLHMESTVSIWSLEPGSGVFSLKCGSRLWTRDLECKVWSLKSGIWNLESGFEALSQECGVCNMPFNG